jgi:hypothetical protein
MSDGQLTIEYIMENYEDWGWLNSREEEINERKCNVPTSWSYIRVRSFTLAINPEANVFYRIDST